MTRNPDPGSRGKLRSIVQNLGDRFGLTNIHFKWVKPQISSFLDFDVDFALCLPEIYHHFGRFRLFHHFFHIFSNILSPTKEATKLRSIKLELS